MQHKKLEYDFKNKYSEKIKDLEAKVSNLETVLKDKVYRHKMLNKDHKELSDEFTRFRHQKEEQEAFRNKQFKSLEDKISNLQ